MCPQQPKAALQDVSKQRALDQTTIVQRDEIFFRPALRTAGKTLSGTSVVHAIPGRIRLRVPSLRFSPHLAKGLVAFLKTQAGVTGASVNIWCHSVTVTCDPLSWTADDLCALLQTLRQEDVEQYELFSIDSAPAPWIRPSTYWKVAGCVTLVLGIILFVLPMVPGGLPFLVLSSFCLTKADALALV